MVRILQTYKNLLGKNLLISFDGVQSDDGVNKFYICIKY